MSSWKELERFCINDGWELYKSTDHNFYRIEDKSGNIRRAKVSRGSGQIPKNLFKEILNKQLQVTKEYFNSKI